MSLLGEVQMRMSNFIAENMDEQTMSGSFDSESFMHKFSESVIKRVK